MHTSICYFSGTGNGFEIGQKLNKFFKGDLLSMPFIQPEDLTKYERILFIFPIYAFGVPTPVNQFISQMQPQPNQKIYVILHYAGFYGNAFFNTQQTFHKYHIPVCHIYGIQMPSNFTIIENITDQSIQNAREKLNPSLTRITNSIRRDETKIEKPIFIGTFMDIVYRFAIGKLPEIAQKYEISSSCNGCGYCERVCPTKNILILFDKPRFGSNCCACLACYNRCPKEAIQNGTKTIGKRRYQNPLANKMPLH